MTVEWTPDLVRHRTIADREAERILYGRETRSGLVGPATPIKPPIFAAPRAGNTTRDEGPATAYPLGGGAAPSSTDDTKEAGVPATLRLVTPNATDAEWFDTRGNVADLVTYLLENTGLRPDQVGEVIEKPWKWTPEYDAMRAAEADLDQPWPGGEAA